MDASVHNHDWINHWPMVINSISSPSLLPQKQGIVLNVLVLLITWLVLLTTSSHPWVDPKVSFPSHFQKLSTREILNSCFYCSVNSKGFQSCEAGTMDEDQAYFLYIIWMMKYIFSYKSQYSQFSYKIKLHKFQPIAPILSKIIPKSLLNIYNKEFLFLISISKIMLENCWFM